MAAFKNHLQSWEVVGNWAGLGRVKYSHFLKNIMREQHQIFFSPGWYQCNFFQVKFPIEGTRLIRHIF